MPIGSQFPCRFADQKGTADGIVLQRFGSQALIVKQVFDYRAPGSSAIFTPVSNS